MDCVTEVQGVDSVTEVQGVDSVIPVLFSKMKSVQVFQFR